MLNVHLSYKPTSYWRIMFWSGGYPSQFSRLKVFRVLVVSIRGCCKGIIPQGIMTPTRVLTDEQSCLRRKGYVKGAYVHATIESNSIYVHTVRQSIYETIRTKHLHFLI